MSNSVERIISVLECLSDTSSEGFLTSELVARLDMPPSTLYRLLSDLEASGHVYRSADRRIHPNFSFERHISFGSISPARLSEACQDISNKLFSAAEIILLRNQSLRWHLREEHPQMALRLRAHPGFLRSTYELDSITRVALASLPIEQIEAQWDLAGFFDVGVAGAKVSWQVARERLVSARDETLQYDLQGNAKGVRRFCVPINDANGDLLCLLTVAEAATPIANEDAHLTEIRTVLFAAKTALETGRDTANAEQGERFAG